MGNCHLNLEGGKGFLGSDESSGIQSEILYVLRLESVPQAESTHGENNHRGWEHAQTKAERRE